MISENEFQRQWRRLFKDTAIEKSTVSKARQLVDQLPPVSPLRVRFEKELDEIETTFPNTPEDPFRLFPGTDEGNSSAAEQKRRRSVHNMERKSLRKLGLDETASAEEIRARYKTLVKRHHPDANGGDRSLEDKLREIIQAYNYLKNAGFC